MNGSEGPTRRELVRDASMIGGVAALLVVIHLLLPPAVRTRFAFDHGAFDPVTVYTSAFVHLDADHLLGNVAGYLAAATLAYGLTAQIRGRRWYRVTFVAFLLVLPVVVSLTSYALLEWWLPGIEPVTRGFSGVGAGFVGFVFVALLAVLGERFDRRTALFVGLAVWLLLVLEVYVVYVGTVTPSVGGLVALGWGGCLWGLLGEYDLTETDWRRRWPTIGLVGTVVVLLTLFVAVLFPSRLVVDGTVTNVFAHATGLLYGMAGSSLTYRALYPTTPSD